MSGEIADLAGHERYLKTTLYGLTSGAPSCVILIVGANAGLIGMSKEHLAIALALSVPVVVCITKVRFCSVTVLLSSQSCLGHCIPLFREIVLKCANYEICRLT